MTSQSMIENGALAALIALAACGDSGPVHGHAAITHVLTDGDLAGDGELKDHDLHFYRIEEDGTFAEKTVDVADDDTFEVPDLDFGPYYAVLDDAIAVTSARNLDLSRATLGRPLVGDNAVLNLSARIDNLSPWELGDDLVLFAPNSGIREHLANLVNPGDTETAITGSLRELHPAFDPASGDDVLVGQTSFATAAAGTLYSMTRAIDSPAPPVMANASAYLDVLLQPVADSKSFAADWDPSAAAAALADANPDGIVASDTTIAIGALPGANGHGDYDSLLELARLVMPESATGPIQQSFDVPTPTPDSWDLVGEAFTRVVRRYELPRNRDRFVVASSGVTDRFDDLNGQSISVPVSPPRNVRINDHDTSAALFGIGPTPTISWDAPSDGTPDFYTVEAIRLRSDIDGDVQTESWLQTTETHATFPPDRLVPGRAYVFRVGAHAQQCTDPEQEPFRSCLPHAWAESITAVVTP